MPIKKLREFLDGHNVKYVVISHSSTHTAQEIAASAHIPGKELAKTVIVKLDDRMVMTVLPGSFLVDFDLLREATGAAKAELASEKEFADVFPDCEVGAMPPFGNLYNLEVLVAQSLTEDKEIAFNAGSHRELIKMSYADFEKLANPKVIRFSVKHL